MMPRSCETLTTRFSDEPSSSTSRPAASAACAMERIRPTLEEKVVMATRPSAFSMIWRSPSDTSCSEGDTPSRSELVLSHINASTPSSPMARKRASSVNGPRDGASSIFQSPV
ncbi:hypothetical protein D3C87_1412860 [compost metagenome]